MSRPPALANAATLPFAPLISIPASAWLIRSADERTAEIGDVLCGVISRSLPPFFVELHLELSAWIINGVDILDALVGEPDAESENHFREREGDVQ